MTYFSHGGRLFENEGASDPDSDTFVYELWEVSGTGGANGRLIIQEGSDVPVVEIREGMEVDLLLRWLADVPEGASALRVASTFLGAGPTGLID